MFFHFPSLSVVSPLSPICFLSLLPLLSVLNTVIYPSFLSPLSSLLPPPTLPFLSSNFLFLPLRSSIHLTPSFFHPPQPLFQPATRLPACSSSWRIKRASKPASSSDSGSGSATYCASDLRISYMRRQCTGKLCVENLNIIHLAHIVESPERHNERVRLECGVYHSRRYGRSALGHSPCGWDVRAGVG